MSQYDVVIIGGGPGGYNAAIRAGQLGLKAAIIEMRETLGGTCLNVGCMPSKALLHASELYEAANREFEHLGIEVSPRLNLPQMMGQKDESVAALTKGVDFLMKKNKVERLLGRGRIAGPGRVEVDGADGKTVTLEARNIVIATGSEPSGLPGVAVDGDRIVDSTGALSLSEVPKTMIVIGAGIIGLELGSVWRRLGAEVTVIEYLDRICPGMDAEVAKTFQRILTKQGVNFRLGSKVTGAKAGKSRVDLTVEPAAGGAAETLSADRVLLAIGRRPYTTGLGLETVGIVPDARGFIETDHFRTSAAGVWAVGDVIHGPMLAHKAEEDGVACIELIAGKAGHVDYNLVPSVVYTTPEVAWVGRNEEQLKTEGRSYKAGKFPFAANSRAKINHETDGFVKVLADAATDEILGVHILGPQAGELIGEYCVAMAFRAASEDIARVCHPHPTRSEAGRQAAMGVEGWTMQA
ncbi:MAG: dihydrolipoyl dehydrogenase [Phenylobacterium sp.]|jgi:dihydrolipoamide dehydrogenase|uniref:dihydrolipoyl dehydrogenase n=2 Tax=Phenylobacterium sp. TaxID=1871053 RepID=UPI002600225B|nr:dihydrolipoyl dehydrogenase [Phenylobacterium sp.]MCA3722849.1 dihydrolipoyl dehydrogenase [Phenylobacterium sp.]MCA3728361.1 dihydrolipoyl dehydrogenase [Phenylobacterium sp.]MCA3745341.1 dihydrolipoyl dehydrogenase [Phenylobacterium sp.]MCA6244961.1 dihydrolipoyl dehydrogenase [Phenylobacterium sp.]MCA6245972.1 dihydrolipoyl dehydrogenase [Phenylobacterium sp.]